MIFLIFLFFEIVILYILSRKTTSKLFGLIRNQYLFAVLFLPGTFIHEMSHFITALFLLVPVGQIELMPQRMEGGIKMGSVPIGKCDPIRRTLIGIAPVVFGLGIIFFSILYLKNPILIGIISFEVGNTMFSSKKDLEGSLALFITLIIFSVAFYLLGLRINLNINQEIIKQANIFLLAPILIDLVINLI